MTIQFNCPDCGALIAFDSSHCGKRAACTTCRQHFIIPSKDYETPKKIAPPPVEKGDPLPGFYKAVLVDSWKIFVKPANVTSLAFVVVAVCLNFFLGRAVCCINYITFVFVWGWLLGFYLNIIYETAFGSDDLPEIYLGTSITFLWNVVKPFLIFFFTMIVVQIPFIVAVSIAQAKGARFDNIQVPRFGLPLLFQILFVLGLLFFPMAVLTIAIAKDILMLRPDYIFKPVFKAPFSYLLVVVLLVFACYLEVNTSQYDYSAFAATAVRLAFNFLVQVFIIIAMRAIGLFYRHYKCYLPW